MTELKNFASLDLPPVQQAFLSHFNGTIESVLAFPALSRVLNPTFSYHYFIVKAGMTMETTVTTKDTDGTTAPWGSQTQIAEHNAALLAKELKAYFRAQTLFFLPNNDGEFTPYKKGSSFQKRKLFIRIGERMHRIVGLTTSNLY